jgi:beta-glucosidase
VAPSQETQLIATLRLGSVLSGGGSTPTPNTPAAWVDMVNEFQQEALSTRLGIPIIYGIDAVHGHGNVYGATVFPHNIGLGSTRDPALVREVGQATAEEVRATGIPWSFGPCVCVARDERWGRTYESFGEDPRWCPRWRRSLTAAGSGERRSPPTMCSPREALRGDGDTEYDYAPPRQRGPAVVPAALHDRPGHHGDQRDQFADRPGAVHNGDQRHGVAA